MKKIKSFLLFLFATSIAYSQNLILNPSAEEPLINGEIPFWTETIGNKWISYDNIADFNFEANTVPHGTLLAPVNSRMIKIKLHSIRRVGDANDAVYDNLYLGSVPLLNISENTIEKLKINISPNPTTGIVSISNQDNLSIDKIEIVDVLGKTISTKTENTSQVDISNMAKGIYIFKIYSGETVFQKKIVKQ